MKLTELAAQLRPFMVRWISDVGGSAGPFAPTPHNLLGSTHGDVVDHAPAEGDLIVGNASNQWEALAHPGAAYRHLETTATSISWVTDVTLPDGSYVGLGPSSARMEFDSTLTGEVAIPDGASLILYSDDLSTSVITLDGATGQANIADDLVFDTANRGLIYPTNTAGYFVRFDGTRGTPGPIQSGDLPSIDHGDLTGIGEDDHHAAFIALEDNAGTTISPAGDNRIQITDDGAINADANGNVLELSIAEGQINHDNLAGFVGNEHINHTSVTLSAGDGLTGGGDISANRTVDMGTPGTVSVSSGNTLTASSHFHNIASVADVSAGLQSILQSDASGYLSVAGFGVGASATADNAIIMVDNGWIGLGFNHRIQFDSTGDDAIYFKTTSEGNLVLMYEESANDKAILRIDPENAYDEERLQLGSTAYLEDDGTDLYLYRGSNTLRLSLGGEEVRLNNVGTFYPGGAKTQNLGSGNFEWDNIYYVNAVTGTSRLINSSKTCPVCDQPMKKGTGSINFLGEDADYEVVFCVNCGALAVEERNRHTQAMKDQREQPPEIRLTDIRTKEMGTHDYKVMLDFDYGNGVTNSTRLGDDELATLTTMKPEDRRDFIKQLGLREWMAREEGRIMREHVRSKADEHRALVSDLIGAAL